MSDVLKLEGLLSELRCTAMQSKILQVQCYFGGNGSAQRPRVGSFKGGCPTLLGLTPRFMSMGVIASTFKV
jgi:hypothetical protein